MNDQSKVDLFHIKVCATLTLMVGSVAFICSNDHTIHGLILGIMGLIGIIFAAIAGRKDDKNIPDVGRKQKDS
jgi:hypothetical protein